MHDVAQKPKTKTYYVASYPEICSVILKETYPSDHFPHRHNPHSLYASNWADAKDFLTAGARTRLNRAREDLARAEAHMAEVDALQDPESPAATCVSRSMEPAEPV
jgi:hypothetical protein